MKAATVIRNVMAIVTFLLALQMTSLPHLVGEAFGCDDEDCCNPCSDRAPGQKCPPLCSTCSCGHAGQFLTPVPNLAGTVRGPAEIPGPALASPLHDDPDPDGVFHPPRV